MYAIVKTGGKQYRVAKNDLLTVEQLPAGAGETVRIEPVLLLGDGEQVTLGTPVVAGALVEAQVVEQSRGPKLSIFKKRRRKHYRRRTGHRQEQTVLRITNIVAGA
ncbi:MAG: 50S ribosomal protein L21 [Alphaproteobacteria bacterium]|nr:50S ribosomal protein L21 [Alphaproteobacteria bacterium]